MPYHPGQAVSVVFPGDPKKRFYSISSSPTEPTYLEITLQATPEHPLYQQVQTLKRGDPLELEGPFSGGLALPDPLTEPMCLVAAGTGVTPFRSMIKFLVDHGSPVEVWLLHSVKRQADLLFREEFQDWAGMNRWLHYVPTITRDADENWINETGRINETMIEKHIPKKPVTYLLCGPPAFVSDLQAMLTRQLNVSAEHIRKEKW